jgi:hypothetical protein
VDAGGLGEDIGADDGGVVGDALAGEILHQLADAARWDSSMPICMPSWSRRFTATSASEALPARSPRQLTVQCTAAAPALGGGQHIGGGQAVVVVGVEIEPLAGKRPIMSITASKTRSGVITPRVSGSMK